MTGLEPAVNRLKVERLVRFGYIALLVGSVNQNASLWKFEFWGR